MIPLVRNASNMQFAQDCIVIYLFMYMLLVITDCYFVCPWNEFFSSFLFRKKYFCDQFVEDLGAGIPIVIVDN